jgi:hypothetical protein
MLVMDITNNKIKLAMDGDKQFAFWCIDECVGMFGAILINK